jgi:hypothetical protein
MAKIVTKEDEQLKEIRYLIRLINDFIVKYEDMNVLEYVSLAGDNLREAEKEVLHSQ